MYLQLRVTFGLCIDEKRGSVTTCLVGTDPHLYDFFFSSWLICFYHGTVCFLNFVQLTDKVLAHGTIAHSLIALNAVSKHHNHLVLFHCLASLLPSAFRRAVF